MGVVTSAVLASFGHEVWGLDIDQSKVDLLSAGKVPFFEPELQELLDQALAKGSLKFTTSYEQAVANADVVMIAVGTPSASDGAADLKFVEAASISAAEYLKNQAILVLKSTVPPGTKDRIEALISNKTDVEFAVASMPEFLKEGSAVADTLNPDRIVIGSKQKWVIDKLLELNKDIPGKRIIVSPDSAQMAKYSANSYLAQRITFINQVANLCEKNGANINEVIECIGADKRIGSHYWYPGLGYGGSCFPKDVKELAAYAKSVKEGNGLLVKIDELNDARIYQKMEEYEDAVGGFRGKNVAVLGLSFKPNTNDMREAPSTKVIPLLREKGAIIKAYDPQTHKEAERVLGKMFYAQDAYEACEHADVILLLVEWDELVKLNLDKITELAADGCTFIDTRNQYKRGEVEARGMNYIGIGIS